MLEWVSQCGYPIPSMSACLIPLICLLTDIKTVRQGDSQQRRGEEIEATWGCAKCLNSNRAGKGFILHPKTR